MGVMKKTSHKYCSKCEFYSGGMNSFHCCEYILKTGRRRNCPIGECDKFLKKGEKVEKRSIWDET